MLCFGAYADPDAHSKSNGHTDTMYGKMWSDTAATPRTALETNATLKVILSDLLCCFALGGGDVGLFHNTGLATGVFRFL